jgi:hypothetical protein
MPTKDVVFANKISPMETDFTSVSERTEALESKEINYTTNNRIESSVDVSGMPQTTSHVEKTTSAMTTSGSTEHYSPTEEFRTTFLSPTEIQQLELTSSSDTSATSAMETGGESEYSTTTKNIVIKVTEKENETEEETITNDIVDVSKTAEEEYNKTELSQEDNGSTEESTSTETIFMQGRWLYCILNSKR